jgi:transketolase
MVSMPSWELFERQGAEYRRTVLPAGSPRLAVEAAAPLGWHRWVGEAGEIVALSGFGASGPAEDLARHFGLTADAILARAEGVLGHP